MNGSDRLKGGIHTQSERTQVSQFSYQGLISAQAAAEMLDHLNTVFLIAVTKFYPAIMPGDFDFL